MTFDSGKEGATLIQRLRIVRVQKNTLLVSLYNGARGIIDLCMDKEALPAFVRVLAQKNEAEEHVILSAAKNLSEQRAWVGR